VVAIVFQSQLDNFTKDSELFQQYLSGNSMRQVPNPK
jgi:hypothetical protein